MRVTMIVGLMVLAGCKSDIDLYNQTGNDEWAQSPNNEVDILFIVDDSASMAEEQEALSAGFEDFIGNMVDTATDFHLGVISTSFEYANPNRGQLIGTPAFLTVNDDYVAGFQDRVGIGTGGSDKEKGLEAAAYALSPTLLGGAHAGFIRPEASLLIVVVSDEEDCSDDAALEGQPPDTCYTRKDDLVPVEEYVDAFQNMKVNKDMVQLAAIVGIDDGCPDAFVGTRYLELAGYTRGVVGNICSTDWGGIMFDVGLNASSIKATFTLTFAAVVDESFTVHVDLDGSLNEPADETADDVEIPQDPIDGWTYDATGPSITFHGASVPPRGATIFANYTVDPAGPADATGTAE